MLTPMLRYPFKNIANFRDLGGLPAEENGMTRWGVFYRSADLSRATPEEMDFILNEMNIRTIIDLRAPIEIEKWPDPFMTDKRFHWLHHSVIGDIGLDDDMGITFGEPDTRTMYNFYKFLLERCPHEIKSLMNSLAESVKKGAVLFHCSAGKDRTGITAMFLLSLCGVTDYDIVSQYEISRTLLAHARPEDNSGSHYSNMENLLAYLRDNHKTPTDYLLTAGVGEDTLKTLKLSLYEPLPKTVD